MPGQAQDGSSHTRCSPSLAPRAQESEENRAGATLTHGPASGAPALAAGAEAPLLRPGLDRRSWQPPGQFADNGLGVGQHLTLIGANGDRSRVVRGPLAKRPPCLNSPALRCKDTGLRAERLLVGG